MAAKTTRTAVWLISLLKRKELTLDEIKREYENSSLYEGKEFQDRTLRNYIELIRQDFGINVKTTKITTGMHIYHIEDGDQDMDAIKQFAIDFFTICNTLVGDTAKVRDRILFQKINTGSKYLIDIIKAMADSVQIEIQYSKFNGSVSNRILEPFFLKVYSNRWYLIAREGVSEGQVRTKEERKKLKTFSLDKITSLKHTRNKFKYDYRADPEAFFSDCFGIFVDDGEPEDIILKFTGRSIKYVKNRVLHRSQVEQFSSENMYIVRLKVYPTYDFVQELLKFGSDVEVLAPESFRKEMKDTICEMYDIYNK